MQSGLGKSDKWLIEFETEDTGINPLMGWETNSNTLSELNLEFSSKELVCGSFVSNSNTHIFNLPLPD